MLRCFAAFLLTAVTACASAGGSAATGDQLSAETAIKPSRNVILPQDMEQIPVANLYEAVVRLHPEWLNVRATGSAGQRKGLSQSTDTEVQVFLDMQRAGTAEFLRTMAIRGVVAVRYYSASDAQARFGSGNLSGVIQVVTAAK